MSTITSLVASEVSVVTRVTLEDIQELQTLMGHCFKHAPVPLSSGKMSNYYYEGKIGTLYPPAARLIGKILVDVILELGAEAVGGIETGAIPIASAIGQASLERDRILPTFFVRQQAKKHGTQSQTAESFIEGGAQLLSAGRRVAIVDDVITTGKSVDKAIKVVEELGCVVVGVAALVERHESHGTALRGRGYPILRIFYTDEQGRLFIDDEFVRRTEEAAQSRLLPR